MNDQTWRSWRWFPERRMDPDFPLALWLAGLWFYLKGFLYFCYVYMAGMDPLPYSLAVKAETAYFSITLLPCLLLGLAMWNEKTKFVLPAILFLGLDTPVLGVHVLRLANGGFLDSGLSKIMELGSVTLNLMAFAWLIGYFTASRAKTSGKRAG